MDLRGDPAHRTHPFLFLECHRGNLLPPGAGFFQLPGQPVERCFVSVAAGELHAYR